MPRLRSILLTVMGATALVTLILATSAASAAGPPVGKIYDCWNFNEQSGSNMWTQSVQLKSKTRYLVGDKRKGKRLVGDIASGRYRVRGRKMTFTSGPLAIHHITGVYKPAGKGYKPHKENELDIRFDLHQAGDNFATCYAS